MEKFFLLYKVINKYLNHEIFKNNNDEIFIEISLFFVNEENKNKN